MKRFKKRSVLLTLALMFLSTAAAQGQEFWEKKPYERWSEEEVRKLLTDSPWAKGHSFSETYITPVRTPGTGRAPASDSLSDPSGSPVNAQIPNPSQRDGSGRGLQARPELRYQAQFRSALPIRQALVRLSQIQAKYDGMTPEQKQAFDQISEAFLAKSFADKLVIYITYLTNIQTDDREMAAHWQSQTLDTLKSSVFLILPGGGKVPISEFGVAKGGREFQFVFPRNHEGRPIVSTKDKTLQIEFLHPKIRDQKESRVLIPFKVEKMLVNGELVY